MAKNAAAKVSSTIQIAHAELKANAFSGNNDDMVGTKAFSFRTASLRLAPLTVASLRFFVSGPAW